MCSAAVSFLQALYFSNSCQTDRTDLRHIFRVGRTMAADDQSEISFFSITQETLLNFVGFSAWVSLDAGG